jgi:plastocyanin
MSNSACAFRVAPALAIALGLLLFGSGPVPAAAAANTHTVNIDGTRFDPETITVKAGDTIVWVNKDPFPHTATSQAGAFDSKEIPAGKSWRFKTTKAGVFAYTCTLHPTMKATLKVE